MIDDLNSFDDKTLEELFTRLEEIRNRRNKPIQIREIVPVEKWLEDEYYVGKDGIRLYDFWKQEITNIYNSPTKINEVILTGGIGIGKTTAAIFIMIRKLYELSCYENIPLLFPNLMANSQIVFTYFMVTKGQAEQTGFRQLRDTIDSIPYFQYEFPRNYDINSRIEWPNKNLMFIYGSSSNDFIGMNALGSILDEANFFKAGSSGGFNSGFSKVSELYRTIIHRSKSRFQSAGRDESLSILISSATTVSSFTEERIRLSAGDPTTYVINARGWDVKPKGSFSDKKFWVFTGTEVIDPMVIESVQDMNQFFESIGKEKVSEILTVDDAIKFVPDSYKHLFIDVPIDFKREFKTDIIRSLQDLAGVPVSSEGRLFTSKSSYYSCIDERLKHPFTKETFTVATGDSLEVKDFFIPGFQFIEPNKPHFIHVDQSTTSDSTGFSVCHISKIFDEDGYPKPEIVVDLMVKITPPSPPRKISISKIRDFIFYLRDYIGINIVNVSYDKFGSQDSVQILEEGGFNVSYTSVDRTDKPYLALANLFFENRIKIYDYSPFQLELFSLIHDRERGKVDHPSSLSKDVSDAVCGAVWDALNYDLSQIRSLDEDYSGYLFVLNDSFMDDDFVFDFSDLFYKHEDTSQYIEYRKRFNTQYKDFSKFKKIDDVL